MAACPATGADAWARRAIAACATRSWAAVVDEQRDALAAVPVDAAGTCAAAYRDRLSHNQVAIRAANGSSVAAVFFTTGSGEEPYVRALRLARKLPAFAPVLALRRRGCAAAGAAAGGPVFARGADDDVRVTCTACCAPT